MGNLVELSVVRSDVAEVEAELLLLKYARRLFGADEMIVSRLARAGVAREPDITPDEGDYLAIETQGAIAAERVLFLGAPELRDFRYKEMRAFAARAIGIIDERSWPVKTLAATVHGAGYGLDIEESLHAMTFGFQQAIARGLAPSLERIVFVERNARRYDLLKSALAESPSLPRPIDLSTATPATTPPVAEPERKKMVFVAMPFAQEFDDVYQFGVYNTVRRRGFVCERVDESYYAGNIVDRIMEGIRNAEFVIADLTAARPNVYLEVGFAWGLERPVILAAREGQQLHFDLSHHKCIFYPTIGKLAEELDKTIADLFASQ